MVALPLALVGTNCGADALLILVPLAVAAADLSDWGAIGGL